jgi:hypothetical protein
MSADPFVLTSQNDVQELVKWRIGFGGVEATEGQGSPRLSATEQATSWGLGVRKNPVLRTLGVPMS